MSYLSHSASSPPLDGPRLLKQAEATLEKLGGFTADAAFIMGSGWGGLEESMTDRRAIPYAAIEGLGVAQVAGHAGTLLAGTLGSMAILAFQGRRHWYEGCGWEPVALPVFIARAAGARVLTLTNTAGGIRPDLRTGDLMVVDDHINWMGGSPLIGAWDGALGPRFPDQSAVYDAELRGLLHRCAREAGFEAPHGVYLATAGPAYETPAEVAAFARLGADAVGMSTVPEAMLANRMGMRVCAVSCISNPAAGLQPSARLSHEEVLDATRHAAPRMAALLCGFADRLPAGAPRRECPA